MQPLDVNRFTRLRKTSPKLIVAHMADESLTNAEMVERHRALRARFLDPEQTGRDEIADTRPRDCVRTSPTVVPEVTQLVGFDDEGRSRLVVIMPTDLVTTADEEWILDRVRAMRPKSDDRRTIRLIG